MNVQLAALLLLGCVLLAAAQPSPADKPGQGSGGRGRGRGRGRGFPGRGESLERRVKKLVERYYNNTEVPKDIQELIANGSTPALLTVWRNVSRANWQSRIKQLVDQTYGNNVPENVTELLNNGSWSAYRELWRTLRGQRKDRPIDVEGIARRVNELYGGNPPPEVTALLNNGTRPAIQELVQILREERKARKSSTETPTEATTAAPPQGAS